MNENAAPKMPLTKYSVMNRFEPSRSSTRGPKKYRASMLNRMCEIPFGSWRNMYVTIVHGW